MFSKYTTTFANESTLATNSYESITFRINPPNSEAAQGGGGNSQANAGNVSARQRNFQFDQVFSPNRRQDQVYEGLGISKLINRVVDVSAAATNQMSTLLLPIPDLISNVSSVF